MKTLLRTALIKKLNCVNKYSPPHLSVKAKLKNATTTQEVATLQFYKKKWMQHKQKTNLEAKRKKVMKAKATFQRTVKLGQKCIGIAVANTPSSAQLESDTRTHSRALHEKKTHNRMAKERNSSRVAVELQQKLEQIEAAKAA